MLVNEEKKSDYAVVCFSFHLTNDFENASHFVTGNTGTNRQPVVMETLAGNEKP